MEKHNQLSAREKEVVIQVLQAKSNKQIALALGISARTVEFHLKNVYTKFQVSSRIELILKLGNATGNPISDNLGQSTVDRQEENTENRDRRNSLMDWAASFRDTVSIIGKEPEMKKRWCIYFFAGLIFGAAYWHYFSQTARFFNEFSSGGNTDGAGWLLILALLTYFSVWLIPATLPAIIEFRRSTSLRLSVMAVVAVCVSAVLGFWQDWGAAFPRLIFYNFVKWAVVWILISGITGLITSSVCVALSKKNYRVIHPV